MHNEKLKRFANDKVMNEAVREVVSNTILNRKGTKDVYILAAERIAIDIIREAWGELDRYKQDPEEKSTTPRQIGL
jgi:hypothetical protein